MMQPGIKAAESNMAARLVAARSNGYTFAQVLPTGEVAAVHQMTTTFALILGADEVTYRTRYCYEKFMDAMHALITWNGVNDPPGPWIKQKPEERLGPGARTHEPITRKPRPG